MLLKQQLKISRASFLLRAQLKMSATQKQIISITGAAAERIKGLIAKRDKPCLGIKVGVKQGGCSGLSYTFEYCEEKGQFDEVIEDKGATILIDPKATMFILGTTLDFVDDKIKSGFVFVNPNEKARCGCGSSFSV